MTDRPLWRIGTKKAIELANEALAVQRAFLQECDEALLIAELEVRGFTVTPPIARRTALLLGKRWPPLADADEVRDE